MAIIRDFGDVTISSEFYFFKHNISFKVGKWCRFEFFYGFVLKTSNIGRKMVALIPLAAITSETVKQVYLLRLSAGKGTAKGGKWWRGGES